MACCGVVKFSGVASSLVLVECLGTSVCVTEDT